MGNQFGSSKKKEWRDLFVHRLEEPEPSISKGRLSYSSIGKNSLMCLGLRNAIIV